MTSTHVHSMSRQTSPLSRLDFFFGGPCEDIVRLSININAEKSKFYSTAVLYFTLVGLLETKKVQEAKFRDCHWCISIHFASVYFDET